MKHAAIFRAILGTLCGHALAAEDPSVLPPGTDGVAPGKQFEIWLKQHFYQQVDRRTSQLHLVAIGEAAIPALHAAALCDEFRTVTLRQMIPSWEEIVRTPETFNQAVNIVHGALKHYDLPDLVKLLGPERVKIE